MKLKLKKNGKHNHQDVVSSVCWASNNQLYSLSDDKTICIWDINGEFVNKFLDLDCFCTAMQWGPGSKSGNETLAIGTSEGALRIVAKSGKIEKIVEEAHTTAVNKIFTDLDHMH
jgi:WD40 repeat protein